MCMCTCIRTYRVRFVKVLVLGSDSEVTHLGAKGIVLRGPRLHFWREFTARVENSGVWNQSPPGVRVLALSQSLPFEGHSNSGT